MYSNKLEISCILTPITIRCRTYVSTKCVCGCTLLASLVFLALLLTALQHLHTFLERRERESEETPAMAAGHLLQYYALFTCSLWCSAARRSYSWLVDSACFLMASRLVRAILSSGGDGDNPLGKQAVVKLGHDIHRWYIHKTLLSLISCYIR